MTSGMRTTRSSVRVGPSSRSFSTFDQPFSFGYFMMIVILVCLPVALADPWHNRNRLFMLTLPLLGLGLLSTFVRRRVARCGGWRPLPRVQPTSRLPSRDPAWSRRPPVPARRRVVVGVVRDEFAGTVDLWSTKLVPVLQHPLGAGIGTAGATAEKVQLLQKQTVNYFQPDNNYLLVAYELGLFGLLGVRRTARDDLPVHTAQSTVRAGPDAAFAAGTAAFVLAIATASTIATVLQILPRTSCLDLLTVVATSGAVAVTPVESGQRIASMR